MNPCKPWADLRRLMIVAAGAMAFVAPASVGLAQVTQIAKPAQVAQGATPAQVSQGAKPAQVTHAVKPAQATPGAKPAQDSHGATQVSSAATTQSNTVPGVTVRPAPTIHTISPEKRAEFDAEVAKRNAWRRYRATAPSPSLTKGPFGGVETDGYPGLTKLGAH